MIQIILIKCKMDFEDIIVNIGPLLKGQDLLFFSRVNKMYYNISNKIIQHKTLQENVEEWMSIKTITYSCVLHPSVNIDKFLNFDDSDTYTVTSQPPYNAVIIKYKKLSIKLHRNKSMMISGSYDRNINNYLDTLFNTKNCASEPIIRLVNVQFRIPKVTQGFIDTYYPKAVEEKTHYVIKNKTNKSTCLIYKTGGIVLSCKNFEPCFDFYKEMNTNYNNYINNINTLLYHEYIINII